MKKFLSIIMALLFSQSVVSAKVGDIKGSALHTDIIAYINHYAISSYAVDGQSCVVAEDLRNFGFDVEWDESNRCLNISRNSSVYVTEQPVSQYVTPVNTTPTYTEAPQYSSTVYVTPTEKRYHYSKSCAGKNGRATTVSKAENSGYTPCKKCC